MLFRNYRIIFRIGLVIAIFCFLMFALATVEYLAINRINEKLEQLVNQTYVKVELAQDMRFLSRHKAVLIRYILLLEDQAEKEFELQRIRDEEKEYDEALSRLTALVKNQEEKAILDSIVEGQKETEQLWDKVIQYGLNGQAAEGTKLLLVEVRSRQWGWLESLNTMVEQQKKYARANYAFTLATSSKIHWLLAGIDVLAIGIGLFLAIIISRSITGPLTDFTRKVEKIAQDDLSVQIDCDTRDEIGLLGKHINHMARLRKKNQEELDDYRLHLEELVEQKTEELNRQREKFASILIHDLKGPVIPLLGFTKRLIEGKTKTPEDTLTYLKSIEKSSQQFLVTIEKTSRNLREKSAWDMFNPEQFDICHLAWTIAASFIPRIEDRQLSLQFNNLEKSSWEKLEPILFRGDPGQLKTLIENLLGNAVKYAVKMIKLELWKADNMLQLCVSDDGPGIAQKYHEKIFEQYFQVPGSRKGTGIGLYSVQRVTENHKGRISVDSLPDKGTSFRVVLPDS
ncbi:MAG: ATP-binding protein [Desulfobulbaceae bacterium]|nr:ATP-binding protein [Desulfobulbaceae bacterium]